MPRSIKKGPYADEHLLKKIETFLTTTHPRPRGRPKEGFSWNFKNL